MISSISAIFLTTLSAAAYPAADILNGVYFFQNVNSGKFLQDRQGAVEVSSDKGEWQKWIVTEVEAEPGKYLLKSHRGNFLEDREGEVRTTAHHFDWQEWVFENNGDGTFYIRSHRGEYLRDKSTNWMFWDRGVDVTEKRDTWEKWTLINDAKPIEVLNEGQACESESEDFCGTGAACCRQGDTLCGERGSPDQKQCTRLPGIIQQIRRAQLCNEEEAESHEASGFDECMAICNENKGNCIGIWGIFEEASATCFTCPVLSFKNHYDGATSFIRDFTNDRRRAEVASCQNGPFLVQAGFTGSCYTAEGTKQECTTCSCDANGVLTSFQSGCEELDAPVNEAHRRLLAAGFDSAL